MKKRTLHILCSAWAFAALLLAPASLQAQEEAPQTAFVFSNGGGWGNFQGNAFEGEGFTAAWNIGEPITEEFGTRPGFDASKKRLTQGFEQGEGYIADPMATRNESVESDGIKLFLTPNPTRGRMQGRLAGIDARLYRLELRNLSGFCLWSEERYAGELELDLTPFPDGLYVLAVTDRVLHRNLLFKIIKVK
ncbi:MAG: hypothetical protein K2J57_01960 [Bacteroidales bacterium]|nr:hypothetical protein [Bacteroidales bacterium]